MKRHFLMKLFKPGISVRISQKIDLESSLCYKLTIMSSTDMIINATTFNAEENTKYAKPKINKSGGKSVGILNSDSNKSLYLSTPLMLTWGVNEFVDDQSGRRTYDMSLQFPKEEYKTEAAEQFLQAMQAFEAKIKADAIKHSKEWLNKSKITAPVVDALFHPMLRYPKDPETGEPDLSRAPTLRIKLDYWDDSFNCEIYDLQQQQLFPGKDDSAVSPQDLIPKATNVAVVIRCGGLWFANGKFGVTWRLVQAVVKPRASLKGKCHIQLNADEVATLQSQADGDEEEANEEVSVQVESSDEEEEEEDKPTFEAPKKVVKKKVVRRKKGADANA